MKNDHTLLSICIPTYNRANVLNGNLDALYKQIIDVNFPIEIIVSDNCSEDQTEAIVNRYIQAGMPINYIRNNENIGMDGNFTQCYRRARGKYILVLGDDDYLIDGMLEKLLNHLNKGDYGLVHLKINSNINLNSQESADIHYDPEIFFQNTSYWLTYITSNIVNSKYILDHNFERYHGTHLSIMPLYLEAASKHSANLIINERVFSDGISSNTNGGYNFFEVFIVNYLEIWSAFVKSGDVSHALFKWIKLDILKRFIIPNAYYLLVRKNVNNYKLENSWKYIIGNYCSSPHLYFYTLLFIAKTIFIKKS